MTRPRSSRRSRRTASCRPCLNTTILAAALAWAGAARAQEATPTEPTTSVVEALQQRAAATEQRLAATEERLAAQQAEMEGLKQELAKQDEARKHAEAEARARAGLFRLGGLQVRLSGYVQADGVLYDQSSQDELSPTGESLNQTRFLIRRARLRVEADYRVVGAAFEVDGNTVAGANARIFAAEALARWPGRADREVPYVAAAIGLTRIPFGFETPQLEWQRMFLERSNISRALFPGLMDLGIRVYGGWNALRYTVALMNGEPAGDYKGFPSLDPNHHKDLLGRLGVDTPLGRRVTLQAGVSALWGTGFHPGTPATKDTLVWSDANLDGQVDPTELTGVIGKPMTPSQTFSRFAVGGDLRLGVNLPWAGELVLLGEVVWASNLDRGLVTADPIDAGRDLRELGWYVAAVQSLTRWAQLGIRYDHYDPDADGRARVAAQVVPIDRSFSTLSVAIAGVYPPYGRLTLEYDHNKNALGRAPSGAPTTLASDVLTLRAQVAF